ncbi:MAG: hypothetical protein ACD_73C00161G0004 [uncultured bacterium]|nr:MAG: hypothetical protein ACD_73C00161G0004 [uncultured bacterium]
MIRKIICVGLFAPFLLMACQNKKAPSSTYYTPPSAVKELRTVYFDYDKAAIRDDQADVLIANSTVLKDNSGWRITIEGHCDERGTNEYNLALGDRRARGTKDYLVNLGVDPARMSTMSYGEERPACTEHDESCWSRNRRADFVK